MAAGLRGMGMKCHVNAKIINAVELLQALFLYVASCIVGFGLSLHSGLVLFGLIRFQVGILSIFGSMSFHVGLFESV